MTDDVFEELLRIYLLDIPVLDGSICETKRKKKMNDNSKTGGIA